MEMNPARPATMQESLPVKLVGQLEEMSWLESLQEIVTHVLQPLVTKAEDSGLMDLLHGRWLGHALHPVLSDLPIGFWTASALFDVLEWDDAATVMNTVGSSAAVGTALTGIADWTVTHGRERRLGLLHGLLNTGGLVLQLTSLVARARGRRSAGRGFGLLGWTVSLAAAYLGGDLVFGRGLMVDHNAWQAGPQEWTAVAALSELQAGKPNKVEVQGRAVLLYREDGSVHAMEDTCSHAGGPLSEGTVENGIVTCPWHGSQFRLTDGSLCRGPATYPQLRLEARIRGDQIEVRGREG